MYGSSNQGFCLAVFYTASFGVPHRKKIPPLSALAGPFIVGSSDVRIFGPRALPCSLLQRILWSPTSKENPPTFCLISCRKWGGFLSMWDSKGCDVKDCKAKPLVRRSVHPRILQYI